MTQTFTVYETKMSVTRFFTPTTILALGFAVAAYAFILFVYPVFSGSAQISAGKIYGVTATVFCFGIWIYGIVRSKPRPKELVWDPDNKTISFNDTLFHVNAATLSIGRYVPFTYKNTTGTILSVKDGGNELKLTFNSFVLPDEQYTTDERSPYASLYLMDDSLLKDVMAHVPQAPAAHIPDEKIVVEITDRSSRRLYTLCILGTMALVYVIYFTGLPFALSFFILVIVSGAACLYVFFKTSLVKLLIENNILSLTDEKGRVKASCAAGDAKIRLYQGNNHRYIRRAYDNFLIISIDLAGSRRIRFSVTGKQAIVLKEHCAGEINSYYSFRQVYMDTQIREAMPLIQYYGLDNYVDFSDYSQV